MRLVNKKTHLPLVEFTGPMTIFHNRFLEHEMRSIGITIPPGLRAFYEGKDIVVLGDAHFQKAFREIYYLTTMDCSLFQWIE